MGMRAIRSCNRLDCHKMSRPELCDCNVKLLAETAKAWGVTDDDERTIWIPKSQCEMEKRVDGTYDLTLPEWLAMEKGLI